MVAPATGSSSACSVPATDCPDPAVVVADGTEEVGAGGSVCAAADAVETANATSSAASATRQNLANGVVNGRTLLLGDGRQRVYGQPMDGAGRAGTVGIVANAQPSSTPNPNALKFTLDTTLPAMINVGSAEEATSSFERAVFAAPGVVNLFGVNDFVTVTRAPGADWDPIIAAVTSAAAEL